MQVKLAAITAAAALVASAGTAQTLDKVTIGYFLEWPTPNLVAQANGAYEQALGLPVEWHAVVDGYEMSKELSAGHIQIAYSQGLVPFAAAVSGGMPLEAVGIAVSYPAMSACVVRDDSGITGANATALEGRKVATPIGNFTFYKMHREFDHLGVDASKIDIVPMHGEDAADALERGDVAMACAFGDPVERMMKVGHPLMTVDEQEAMGLRTADLVTTTDKFAETHPDLLEKFLSVTEAANAAYKADPAKYLDTISRAAGMERSRAERMLGTFSFPSAEEQKSDVWLGGGVQAEIKSLSDFFAERDQIDRVLESYDRAVDPGYL